MITELKKNHLSDIDKFLNDFDKKSKTSSLSIKKEREKFNKVKDLRD